MQAQLTALLPALRRFAWSLTQSVHDADDLLQATVERLLSKGVPENVDLSRWAFTVCRNLWIDEYRARKIRKTVDVEPEVFESGQVDGEREVHGKLQLNQVMTAMKNLPEDQHAVLSMVAIQGLSYKDVAAELEIPVGTVMSRLSRARCKLAELLAAG
ncbi:RNA polymerase sigma factor [Pseudohongiella nitratireducens]|uniref:RNA polymerase sigma factor n=1 Tax=Pseudohongiella nitratireducens TaxID=1768907 RepID=UPI0030EF5657|tara:strand:+ start:6545 stop:7018 length:474 start_codon:yes stop_codon:yes gene_type:complete